MIVLLCVKVDSQRYLVKHGLIVLLCVKVDSQRYLVKHGLIVEKIAKERKLRHVFLFNDFLVAAKQKIVNRSVSPLSRFVR